MNDSPRFTSIRKISARYAFLAGVVLVLVLAALFPGPGAPEGWLRTGITTGVGVFLIFLIQGLILPTDALWRGLLQWRLHAVVHGFLFVVFPALALGVDYVAGTRLGWLDPDVRLGFLFLAMLPTTISTCVALTASARGNVSGALFNATVSNVLAVFIVPLWVFRISGLPAAATGDLSLIADIGLLVLAPLAIGQGVRPLVREVANRLAGGLRRVTNGIILFILYAAFAGSVASGFWENGHSRAVGEACVLVLVSLTAMHGLAWMAGRLLGFSREDRVAAYFCAPQKSLAMGIPLGQILFQERPEIVLILLPLMLYHAAQLLAGGLVIGRLAERGAARSDTA